jgi:hypothetical protein
MIKIPADPICLSEDIPHLISLGAGVQSSVVALLAAQKRIRPMPIGAIFADVKAEPQEVYKWLEWLENRLPFPVHRVTKREGLRIASTTPRTNQKTGKEYHQPLVPLFIKNADGSRGMLSRQCSYDFKIIPIQQEARRLAKIKRGQKEVGVIHWIGISTDELQRMKMSREKWAAHRWPLIELGMTRLDCLQWMKKQGLPAPPRSACYFCPYHSDREWQRIKTKMPEEFAMAVEFEKLHQSRAIKTKNVKGTPFLHSSLKPLDQIDFENPDPDQGKFGFINECEGICGN